MVQYQVTEYKSCLMAFIQSTLDIYFCHIFIIFKIHWTDYICTMLYTENNQNKMLLSISFVGQSVKLSITWKVCW